MLHRHHEYERMAAVEENLWWYRALHRLVLSALPRRELSPVLLDAGCGTGGLLTFLRNQGYDNLDGFDLSPTAVAWSRRRGFDVRSGDLRHIASMYHPESADVIVSADNLFFLEQDERVLFVAACSRLLRPRGRLILNLPALDPFRGIHDVSVGITHRFSKTELPALFHGTAFRVKTAMYWPFLPALPILFVRWRQRRVLKNNPLTTIVSDIDMPVKALNYLLERVVCWENSWLRWKPFGSSLFVVAEKIV
jgi:SAM-dependent methyltransferase